MPTPQRFRAPVQGGAAYAVEQLPASCLPGVVRRSEEDPCTIVLGNQTTGSDMSSVG